MSSIQTAIQLYDGMTPVLRSINSAMSIMLNTFNSAQVATSTAFDTAAMTAAQQEINNASASLIQYQEQLDRANNRQLKTPEITWKPIQTPEVFMNTGIERFQAELQAADQAANRLAATQETLTAQAAQMQLLPPEMMADVNTVNDKIQALSTSIQGLSNIPASQVTDQTNSRLENMRVKLSQITGIQTDLNSAMERMDISATNAAYQQLDNLVNSVNQGMRDNFQPQSPAPAAWQSIQAPEVIMSTGADRFQAEFQAASQSAAQLVNNQRAITEAAMQMRVMPPGMMNDVAAVGNKVQALAIRVQELNNIPVNMRTDQVNNQLESMRGQLNQAVGIQTRLNTAMSQMDISAANTAYQQLNNVVDATNQDIRNNLMAQEQFNQSIISGGGAANGLESTIKRYAGILLSVASVTKSIGLSDQMAQTSARLDMVNAKFNESVNLQEMIFQSAQRSRGSYLDTANAVAKLGNLAGDAFNNTAELVAFSEQLNKQFVIAGAGVQETQAATLQLTQALASGVLRGDELNSVFEQAPTVIQSIADYMQVPIGEIRELASKGVISGEIVKNAMFAAAEETNRKFSEMPMTFGQVVTQIKNYAIMAFQPVFQQINDVANSDGFNVLVTNVINALQIMATYAVTAFNMMAQGATWVQENWSWLEPVIWGVVEALIVYNAVMGIGWLTTLKNAGAKVLEAGASIKAAAATFIHTAAQNGLNAALMACPITWIIIGIITLITIIYAVIGAINKLSGTSISATGIIGGAFAALGAGIINTFLVPMWNMFAAVANFVGNVFKDPIAAVKVMFYDMASTVLGYIANMAHAIEDVINNIPGMEVDITSGLDHFQDKIKNAADKVKDESEWKEYVKTMDFIDYGDAARAGYEFGEGIEKSVKGIFTMPEIPGFDTSGFGNAMDGVYENTGDTAKNTAAMADNMDILDEDLKYMRDAAEQEIINRFTLADLKIDLTNNNTLTSKTDIEEVGRYFSQVVGEFMNTAAEGAF